MQSFPLQPLFMTSLLSDRFEISRMKTNTLEFGGMTAKPPRPKKYAKPLSLHPVKYEDAVSALLKVKPETKEPKTKKSAK